MTLEVGREGGTETETEKEMYREGDRKEDYCQ